MLGLKKRLHVVKAHQEARRELLARGADVLRFVSQQPDQTFVTRPDIYRMRSAEFPGNWAAATFLFANSLCDKNTEMLCSLSIHLQGQFSTASKPLREFISKNASSKFEPSQSLVAFVFECTFNKAEGVREAVTASRIPVSGKPHEMFIMSVRYIQHLGETYKIHA